MADQRNVRPTDAELAILRVLWDRGPSSVRQVREATGERGVRYTTTLKTMQNMTEKGLVHRDQSRVSHVYSAAIEEEPTQRRLVGEFLDRAFGGSAAKLVMQALAAGDISADELKEIRKLLKDKGTGNERTR
jgi:predicted transcriptional regulator